MTTTSSTTRASSASTQHAPIRSDAVELARLLPSVSLFGAFYSALRPSRILFAFALLLVLVVAGRLWDGVTPTAYGPGGLLAGPPREIQLVEAQESARSLVIPVLRESDRARAATLSLDDLAVLLRENAEANPAQFDAARYAKIAGTIDAARPRASFEALHEAVRESVISAVSALARADGRGAFDATRQLVVVVPTTSWECAPWFTAYFGCCFIIVLMGCGGVLSRLNAGDLSDRQWTVSQARAFIRPRLWAICGAPLFAISFAALLWVPLWLLGVLLNLPVFNVFGALAFGVALVVGGLCALLLTVVCAGLPLMAPAVACDGCDSVESVQRAGAYLFRRPLHLGWYALLSFVVIGAGTLLADFVAASSWSIAIGAFRQASSSGALDAVGSYRFLESFHGSPAVILGATDRATAGILEIWQTLLSLLVGATALSLTIACATRAYLLVRLHSDGQELSDLWVDEDLHL